jgi:hypothetical protein
MNKVLSLALLAAGIMLAFFGFNEMHSFTSDISRALTGSPTDRALWMSIGGGVLIVLGAGGLVAGSRQS